MVYELVGVLSHVADPRFPDKNNLVACIRVGPSYHVRAKVSSVSHWYLFNDIRYISDICHTFIKCFLGTLVVV